MATVTTYQPKTLDDLLARPCGCGELAWYCAPPFGRIECAECGAAFSRPCGLPAPAGQDGPDGGPAASARRPTLWLVVSGQSVPRELSPAEEEELNEFIAACAETAPLPEPCCRCNRPASPYMATAAGPLCFRCWDPGPPVPGTPDRHRPDRAALAGVWVDVLGELAEAKAQLARIDARLAAIRAR